MASVVCDSCGEEIPSWAPAGNCPKCLLGSGPTPTPGEPRETGAVSETIGAWEVRECIGEGAFGVVFAAKQRKPVERTAALKILRPGVGSKEILARFKAESQALALMNHPDVVTVYDAGTTDDGRPYFAMEMVPGVPITEFAMDLSLGEKLGLFDRVCAVVEHAHSRGVIHRDLKPANILAYRDDRENTVVKLLDFGIAKATDDVLTDSTILTGQSHCLGTPEYMSPEQTTEVDIDTRADVYALGVILFELLTGRPPFVLDSQSLDGVLRFLARIREERPPRPSTVVEGVIPADLDWIVMHAIERDRDQRYKSVGDLREDLYRYSHDKPLLARPPDTFYLATKFLRRNWKLATTAALIAVTVVGAAIVSIFMAVRAREAMEETKTAYAMSDLRTAVAALDEGKPSEGVKFLVRSLQTDPENKLATMLLRSTLSRYPYTEVVRSYSLGMPNMRFARFFDGEGSLIAVTELGEILFFDPNGEELAPRISIPGSNQVSALASDGSLIAIGDIQGHLSLIDLETFESLPIESEEFPEDELIRSIEFSPDDSLLCLTTASGFLGLWETETGALRWKRKLESQAMSAAYTDQGRRLVLALLNGDRIDILTEDGSELDDIPKLHEEVSAVVESGAGFRYYSVSSAGEVAAVDPGREPRTFTDQRVEVPLKLTLADPKRRLVAYVGEREMSVWTVMGITIITRLDLPAAPSAAALHPTRSLIAVGMEESGIHLWNYEQDRLIALELSRIRSVVAIQFDENESLLRCISRDGTVQHIRYPDEPPMQSTTQRLPSSWKDTAVYNRNDAMVRAKGLDLAHLSEVPEPRPRCAGISRDGSIVFAAFRDGKIVRWDSKTGERLGDFSTDVTIRACDITTDGAISVFRSRFSLFATFDWESRQQKDIPFSRKRDISSISISPHDNAFASATDGGVVQVIAMETSESFPIEISHDIRGEISPHYVRYSPDGEWLISWGAPDRSFRLWDANDGTELVAPIRGMGIPVFAHFLEPKNFVALVTREQDGDEVFRIWSLRDQLPVTPKQEIDPDLFDFSTLEIPASGRFDLLDLERLLAVLRDS